MNTLTSIDRVCELTELPRADIYRAQELAGLGVPGHYLYQASRLCYTPAGMAALAEGLEQLGERWAASLVRSHLQIERARSERRDRGWLERWQAGQEDAA